MKVFRIIMWVLSAIAIFIIASFIYLFFWGPRPVTTGVVKVGTLSAADGEDVPLEDSTMFMTFNLYKNKNNNGKTLYETQFNQYLGPEEVFKENGEAAIHGYGFQVYDFDIDDFYKASNNYHQVNTKYKFFHTLAVEGYDYYDCIIKSPVYAYEISYLSDHCESVAVPYKQKADSYVISYRSGNSNLPIMLSLRGEEHLDNNYISKRKWTLGNFYNYYTIDTNFFLSQMLISLQSLDEGTHYFQLDLSQYFDVRLYNEETKQFDLLTASKEYTWVTIKANISDDGITMREQSIFKMIASNDGSAVFESEGTPFWQIVSNITLTFEDFEKRFYNEDYYLYLSYDKITDLTTGENVRIHIYLDLPDSHCLGFDSFALYGIKVYDCEIQSKQPIDFVIRKDALKDTGLVKIKTNNVKLIYEEAQA